MRRLWKKSEVQYLIDHPDFDYFDLAEDLDRSEMAVESKCSELKRRGLMPRRKVGRPSSVYDAHADDLIRTLYDSHGAEALSERLGVSARTIRRRRDQLWRGLGGNRPCRAWTAEEREYVLRNHLDMNGTAMANVLGRSRSAVRGEIWRLQQRGLACTKKDRDRRSPTISNGGRGSSASGQPWPGSH